MTKFSDPLDLATDLAERERRAAMAFRFPEPAKKGRCNGPGCTEPTLPGTSFCARECRDAYEAARH